jgi:Ferritin-like
MEPIAGREQLLAALKDAAEIEHQLMVQYLYAAFSLKRDPDAACTPAQFEPVRRWASTLFMIARQEMEHLSLVNGMLTAVGAPPYFARESFGKPGLQSPYFASATLALESGPDDPKPISLPYAFQRFERATVERFVCAESPPYGDLPHDVDPAWCFACESEPAAGGPPRARTWLAPSGPDADRDRISAGTVQELYTAIKCAFDELDGLFIASPPEVAVPVEYDVFVFPVTDRPSAVAAVDLILKQGEGLGDPWNLDSHFRRFFEMHAELVSLQARDRHFDPAYPLLTNPERSEIADDFARAVFDVANRAYATLLLMLASLYQRSPPTAGAQYPYLTSALSQMAFAPMMTMVVRALNEVLVRLPVDDGEMRTGSNYHIGAEDLALLVDPGDERLGDIGFLLERWVGLSAAVGQLVTSSEGAHEAGITASLRYVHQSTQRIGANLRQIYQSGVYSKYVSV